MYDHAQGRPQRLTAAWGLPAPGRMRALPSCPSLESCMAPPAYALQVQSKAPRSRRSRATFADGCRGYATILPSPRAAHSTDRARGPKLSSMVAHLGSPLQRPAATSPRARVLGLTCGVALLHGRGADPDVQAAD